MEYFQSNIFSPSNIVTRNRRTWTCFHTSIRIDTHPVISVDERERERESRLKCVGLKVERILKKIIFNGLIKKPWKKSYERNTI